MLSDDDRPVTAHDRSRQVRPRLRSDLVFRPRRVAGDTIYVVEDPVRSKFYRLGVEEYAVVAEWDGRTPLQPSSAARFSTEQTWAIYRWAFDNELLERPADGSTASLLRAGDESPPRPRTRWNPVVFRLPLVRPEALIAKLYPYLRWLYAGTTTCLAVLLLIVAGACLLVHWDRFIDASANIFTPFGQMGLLACWVVLKLIHELSHGLACRRYGGEAREAGVVMILFFPIAYIDVTSTWRLRSKWQRIHVAAAGMQVEMYLAAVAAIVWTMTQPGFVNQACAHVVVMASLTTLLFNANPLMRFDGYYIVTDLLEIPNLYSLGQHWLRDRVHWVCFGTPATRGTVPLPTRPLIRAYALAAMLWRIFICCGLVVAAAFMWHGAGIVLAVLAVICWVAVPAVRLINYVLGLTEGHPEDVGGNGNMLPSGLLPRLLAKRAGDQPSVRRFAAISAAVAATAMVLLCWTPWPGATRAHGIVVYDPLIVLRAPAAGFVTRVASASGADVRPGELLAVIQSDELEQRYTELELKVKASRLRCRSYRHRRELALLEAEQEETIALEKQRRQLANRLSRLEIRAPRDGRVVTRDVESLLGRYVAEGEVVLALGSEERKQVEFAVCQEDLPKFQSAIASAVSVKFSSAASVRGELRAIDPRASRRPSDVALCIPFGGPLAARKTDLESDRPEEARSTWELLRPHFAGSVPLDADTSCRLRAGQRASVTLDGHRDSLGAALFHRLWRWLDRQGKESG